MIRPKLLNTVVAVALLLSSSRLFAGIDRWTPLGPDGGAVTSLAVASGVPGLVYAGTLSAGVFKSRDGGATWQPALTGLPVGVPILSVAVGGRDGRTLYTATESELFASVDGGGLWTKRPLPFQAPTVVAGLVASPADSQTVFLSFNRDGFYGGGLLKSTDGGRTWKQLDTGLGNPDSPASVLAMAIAPSAPDTIYASGHFDGFQVARSTDGGSHWSPARVLGAPISHDIRLAVDPRDPGTVYAAWDHKVEKSTDGGGTWLRLADVPDSAPEGRIENVAALAVDPAAPATIYLAFNRSIDVYSGWYGGGLLRFAGRIVRTTDGGASWSRPVETDVIAALSIDGVRTSRVYAGVSRIGILRSDNHGAQWSKANHGLTAAPVCSATPDPFARGSLYLSAGVCGAPRVPLASNDDLGFLKRNTAKASGWTNLNQGARDPSRVLEAYSIVADPRTPGTLYAATGQGLFKSVNSGGRWTLQTGLAPLLDAVYRVAVDPSDPETLYGLGYKLGYPICGGFCPLLPVYDAAKSTDGGLTWQKMAQTLPLGFEAEDVMGFELVIDPTDPSVLYLGHASSALFKSIDRGATWKALSGAGNVSRLVIDPAAPQTLYAIAHFPSTAVETVEKSADGGLTWTLAARGLPAGIELRDLALDAGRPLTLYLATARGVFVTDGGGDRWTPLMKGLTKRNIWTIRIDPFDPATIYAGTEGEGGLFVLTRSDR